MMTPAVQTGGVPRRKLQDRDRGYYKLRAEFERRVIKEALQATGGSVTQAAIQLDINRSTLFLKMDRLGLRLQEIDVTAPEAPLAVCAICRREEYARDAEGLRQELVTYVHRDTVERRVLLCKLCGLGMMAFRDSAVYLSRAQTLVRHGYRVVKEGYVHSVPRARVE